MTPRFVAGALVAFIRWRLKREVKNFMKRRAIALGSRDFRSLARIAFRSCFVYQKPKKEPLEEEKSFLNL